jgi:hypothetical protein
LSSDASGVDPAQQERPALRLHLASPASLRPEHRLGWEVVAEGHLFDYLVYSGMPTLDADFVDICWRCCADMIATLSLWRKVPRSTWPDRGENDAIAPA